MIFLLIRSSRTSRQLGCQTEAERLPLSPRAISSSSCDNNRFAPGPWWAHTAPPVTINTAATSTALHTALYWLQSVYIVDIYHHLWQYCKHGKPLITSDWTEMLNVCTRLCPGLYIWPFNISNVCNVTCSRYSYIIKHNIAIYILFIRFFLYMITSPCATCSFEFPHQSISRGRSYLSLFVPWLELHLCRTTPQRRMHRISFL